MVVILGAVIVFASVLGGFTMAGGNVASLLHLSEFIVIGGAAIGAMVIMAPKSVLIGIFKQMLGTLKGAPYNRKAYQDLLMVLYELFMLGKKGGMIALEEHIQNPEGSEIISKYPDFLKNKDAVAFLCDGLRPVVDGQVKADQLSTLLNVELNKKVEEDHEPVDVLTKVGDAMPGFGIVAAVLGIVITMGAISGPIEEIGHKVGTALVGTFLGIFIAYGFLNPLATNMNFINHSAMDYLKCISASLVGYSGGMAPATAIEIARRGLGHEVRPTSQELEELIKKAKNAS